MDSSRLKTLFKADPRWLLLVLLTCLLAACNSQPRAIAQLPATALYTPTMERIATSSPIPTASATPESPTATNASTTTPQPPSTTPVRGDGPGGCVPGATLLGDETVPNGTTIAARTVFIKSWRLRNEGTCVWGEGYTLVFAEGEQLGGAPVALPPAQPQQAVDVSVQLEAPTAPGMYSGVWQLRANNGAFFGQLVVSIQVAALPSTTAPPPSSPTLVVQLPSPTPHTMMGSGPGGCVLQMTFIDDMTIPAGMTLNPRARFTKIWRVRNDGTCSWDATYDLVFSGGDRMDGVSDMAIPDTQPGQVVDLAIPMIAPAVQGLHTGDWQLQAGNGVIFGTLEVMINVLSTASATPAPTVDSAHIWAGSWQSDCGTFNCGIVNLGQSTDGVSGTFGDNGTVTGSVEGNLLEGDWVNNGDSGSFALTMADDGQSWTGTISAGGRWCGWRSGTPKPTQCSPS